MMNMKNKVIRMATKITAMIAAAGIIVGSAGVTANAAVLYSPIENHPARYIEDDFILNKVIVNCTEDAVDQYKIQPGKYYVLYEKHLVEKDTNRVVKVKRVYEEFRWVGYERMVEFVDCSTGITEQIQLNPFFGGNYFYEEIG